MSESFQGVLDGFVEVVAKYKIIFINFFFLSTLFFT